MIQRSEKNGRRSSSRTWAGLIHTHMPHEQLLCLQADRMANSPPMANLGESLDAVSQGGWKLLCWLGSSGSLLSLSEEETVYDFLPGASPPCHLWKERQGVSFWHWWQLITTMKICSPATLSSDCKWSSRDRSGIALFFFTPQWCSWLTLPDAITFVLGILHLHSAGRWRKLKDSEFCLISLH